MTKPYRFRIALLMGLAAVLSTVSGCKSNFCCSYRGVIHEALLCRLGVEVPEPDFCYQPTVPAFIQLEDGIREDEAVVLGLWNSPAYQLLLADLDIAQADLLAAGQLTNPQLSTMFPVGPKQWEFALLMPLDVLVLRPHRVYAAELEANRVAERLVQDGLNVVRDIRIAFAELEFNERQLELAREGDRLRGEITRLAEARLNSGAVAELDIMPIRMDALIGHDTVTIAEQNTTISRERLRYLLGAGIVEGTLRLESEEPPDYEAEPVEDLVQEAIVSRPDVIAVTLAMDAAAEVAKLRRFDYLNISAFLPDMNAGGNKGFEAGPGLQMNVPLFHRNEGARARAWAEYERQRRTYINLQAMVALEVRQAHARYVQSRERVHFWQEQVLPQAKASIDATRSALEQDVLPLLLVLENIRQFLTAQQREAEATVEMRRAYAELERSVGRQLVSQSDAIQEPIVTPEAIPQEPAP